jgi:hypothetical protein
MQHRLAKFFLRPYRKLTKESLHIRFNGSFHIGGLFEQGNVLLVSRPAINPPCIQSIKTKGWVGCPVYIRCSL